MLEHRYGNPNLVSLSAFVVTELTSLAHVVWSASEQYLFETKVLEICNNFVTRYGSRTQCEFQGIKVVEGSSAEASGAYLFHAVLSILDKESNSRSKEEYVEIIGAVVEYLMTTLSNEFSSTSRTQFMGMSYTSVLLELSTYGRIKTTTLYSEGEDISEHIANIVNADWDDIFGSSASAAVLSSVPLDDDRRRRLQESEYETTFLTTWHNDLYVFVLKHHLQHSSMLEIFIHYENQCSNTGTPRVYFKSMTKFLMFCPSEQQKADTIKSCLHMR
jgi:hypothetical protein